MQCRISRLRKYLVFFSPSLCHRDLDLKIVSFVWYSISISCSRLFLSNFVRKSLRLFAEVLAACSSRIFIEFSMSSFFCIVFLFFDFLWLIDASLVFLFIISHNSPGVTECYLTGEYSSSVGVMHQSIPNAPCPPPRADPREFAFFFLWMTNSLGRGHLSCQMPGGKDESRRQMPRYT